MQRDVLDVLNDLSPDLYETMVHELGIQQFKAVLVLCVTVEKPNAAGAIIYTSPFFRSQLMTVLNVSNIPDLLTAAFDGITAKVDAWVQGGSGWAVSNVKTAHLNIVQCACRRTFLYLKS